MNIPAGRFSHCSCFFEYSLFNDVFLTNGKIKIKNVIKMSLCFRNSPGNNYLLKVNNRDTIKRCEICSKLTIKTPCSSVSIVDFKQVIVS